MPLFFIVSGLFIGRSLAKRGLREFILNKWKLLLYPYLLWAIIQVTLQLVLAKYVNAGRTYQDYLYILYAPREIDQFWYLYALFNTSVLYAIVHVRWKVAPLYQLFAGFVLFLISSFLAQRHIFVGFIYDIFHFYIFIALGDLISSYILNKKNEPTFSSWRLFIVILPFFAVCQWYFLVTNLSHSTYSFVEESQPLLFLVIALSGCMLMTNISFILQRYNALPALRIIGYHSLYIYLMHVLASSATRIVLTRVFGINNVPVLLILGILMGLLIPLVFYKLAMKAGAWWLFSLENDRPQDVQAKKDRPVREDVKVI